jgi:hypothetical protein
LQDLKIFYEFLFSLKKKTFNKATFYKEHLNKNNTLKTEQHATRIILNEVRTLKSPDLFIYLFSLYKFIKFIKKKLFFFLK